MFGNLKYPILLLWVLLLLTGCSSSGNDEDIVSFVEPKPGRTVGLKKEWSRSVEGTPKEYMNHPRQIAVTQEDVFVGTYGGQVVRVDKKRGKIVWQKNIGSEVVGGVAVWEDLVFAGSVAGKMVALSREDGKQVWESSVATTVASAPAVTGDKVIFTTLDNRTYALDSKSGKLQWTHSSVPQTLVIKGAATPVVNGELVYVGYSTGELFAINLSNGKVIWTQNLSRLSGRSEFERLQDLDAEMVVGKHDSDNLVPKIYAVNHQGYIKAFHVISGEQIWEQKFSAIRRPLLWGSQLFVSAVGGHIVSISSEDGLEVWRTEVSDGYLTAPVRLGNRIIVGDNMGRLLSLDPTSGRVVGLDKRVNPIIADPVVDGVTLLLWTNEGDLIRYTVDEL
ncbi:MAG: outer membrane protein assembly factor BamB [Magnetococcales bacterium]|nr:outer membrane protein assembly factor BamB [Magnetococcales bacterium]